MVQSLSWGQIKASSDRYYIIANHDCQELTNAPGRACSTLMPKLSPKRKTFQNIVLVTVVFFDIWRGSFLLKRYFPLTRSPIHSNASNANLRVSNINFPTQRHKRNICACWKCLWGGTMELSAFRTVSFTLICGVYVSCPPGMPRTPREQTVKVREEGNELASEINVKHLHSQTSLVETRSLKKWRGWTWSLQKGQGMACPA